MGEVIWTTLITRYRQPSQTGRIGTQSLITKSQQTKAGTRLRLAEVTWTTLIMRYRRPSQTGRIGTRSLTMRSPETRDGTRPESISAQRPGLFHLRRMIDTRTVLLMVSSTPPSAPTSDQLTKAGTRLK